MTSATITPTCGSWRWAVGWPMALWAIASCHRGYCTDACNAQHAGRGARRSSRDASGGQGADRSSRASIPALRPRRRACGPQDGTAFQLGKAITVRSGSDVTLISTGGMLHDTVQAADVLGERGIKTRVISMHTVKPLDEEAVLAAARETQAVFTVEEHSIIGGLGGAVAELLLESCDPARNFQADRPQQRLLVRCGDTGILAIPLWA